VNIQSRRRRAGLIDKGIGVKLLLQGCSAHEPPSLMGCARRCT